ncbi:hypothetical protein PAAG_06258 [Paracoccidioides lutzii Pb01]|uniref:Uncharacterized protein n=1 Tax=Paracoccidioides lutzii (strain ATCC MYA-826 / Pb01) TaxID=502779 RepID=C1H5R3_PARBA|nr:hypothetical protein PAAG_06258 [Paracoccidioides lutzii Pb01]EEH35211.2 hypothetical protein PAAG_06258 [Paracoccidioides lutzii Pb01]
MSVLHLPRITCTNQADWNKPQKYQQSDNCDERAAPNEKSSSSSSTPSHQVAGLKEKNC